MTTVKITARKILEGMTAGCVWIHFLMFVPGLFRFCPLDFVEFESAAFGLLMAREGLAAYRPLFYDLITVGYYGPLYYAVPAVLGRAAGLEHNAEAFLFLMRGVSFLFAALSSALLGYLTARLSGERLLGWLASAAFFSLPWAVQGVRPDFPAFFFVFAALGLVLRGDRSKLSVNISAALLCSIAVLHLQRVGAFAAAYGIVLIFFEKRFAQAAYFWMVLTAGVLIPVLMLEVLTGGAFLKHTVEFLYFVSEPRAVFAETWRTLSGRLLKSFMVFCLIVFCASRRRGDFAVVLTGVYFLASAAFSFVTTRSVGAGANHFLEPIASAILMLAAVCRGRRNIRVLTGLFLTLFLFRGMLLHLHGIFDKVWLNPMQRLCVEDPAVRDLFPEGPVLSDYCFIPYLTGRAEAVFNMADWAGPLASRGKYDPEVTRRRIRQKEFAAVTFAGKPVFSELFRSDLEAHYKRSFSVGASEVWLPRKEG